MAGNGGAGGFCQKTFTSDVLAGGNATINLYAQSSTTACKFTYTDANGTINTLTANRGATGTAKANGAGGNATGGDINIQGGGAAGGVWVSGKTAQSGQSASCKISITRQLTAEQLGFFEISPVTVTVTSLPNDYSVFVGTININSDDIIQAIKSQGYYKGEVTSVISDIKSYTVRENESVKFNYGDYILIMNISPHLNTFVIQDNNSIIYNGELSVGIFEGIMFKAKNPITIQVE